MRKPHGTKGRQVQLSLTEGLDSGTGNMLGTQQSPYTPFFLCT